MFTIHNPSLFNYPNMSLVLCFLTLAIYDPLSKKEAASKRKELALYLRCTRFYSQHRGKLSWSFPWSLWADFRI